MLIASGIVAEKENFVESRPLAEIAGYGGVYKIYSLFLIMIRDMRKFDVKVSDNLARYVAGNGYGVEGCFGCYDFSKSGGIVGKTLATGSGFFPEFFIETNDEELREIVNNYLDSTASASDSTPSESPSTQ